MKSAIKIILLFCICAYLSSCKKDAAAPTYVDTPIVQAFLQVGSPALVNVSKLIPYDPNAQNSQSNIDGLDLHIISGNNNHTLNSIGGGNYVDSSLIITDTATYLLQFNYNGKLVSATTKALSKPQGFTQSATVITITQIPVGQSSFGFNSSLPPPITLNWSNPDNSYYIVVVQNTETNPVLINLNDTTAATLRVFRNEPTQDVTSLLNARQFKYYGNHTITLYHVLSDYADLYKNSGVSSQNLTTPTTNITNGLGIFTAINSSVLYVNVHKQ